MTCLRPSVCGCSSLWMYRACWADGLLLAFLRTLSWSRASYGSVHVLPSLPYKSWQGQRTQVRCETQTIPGRFFVKGTGKDSRDQVITEGCRIFTRWSQILVFLLRAWGLRESKSVCTVCYFHLSQMSSRIAAMLPLFSNVTNLVVATWVSESIIQHLGSSPHFTSVKSFFWEQGAGVDDIHHYSISKDEMSKVPDKVHILSVI